MLWRRGFAQMLLEKSNGFGVEALVKFSAIEARRVGADGSKLLRLFWRAESKEGKVFRTLRKMVFGL
jgi:hypothetical protein